MDQFPEGHQVETDQLASSEENLIAQAPPRGASNSKALKIAGLTTVVCLLLSSQIFTAYMVFDQRQQLRGLQKSSEKLKKDLDRSPPAKTQMKIQMPMNSLVMDFSVSQNAAPTEQPEVQKQDSPVSRLEKQLVDVMRDLNLPRFNRSFLENMRSLKQQMNETEWKSFETWMRYWQILQRSQQKSTPPPTPPPQPDMPVIKTRCQIEASANTTRLGSYKPQCDEQGRYQPMQCWHSSGFCWCVDETGTTIEGTASREKIYCGEY